MYIQAGKPQIFHLPLFSMYMYHWRHTDDKHEQVDWIHSLVWSPLGDQRLEKWACTGLLCIVENKGGWKLRKGFWRGLIVQCAVSSSQHSSFSWLGSIQKRSSWRVVEWCLCLLQTFHIICGSITSAYACIVVYYSVAIGMRKETVEIELQSD